MSRRTKNDVNTARIHVSTSTPYPDTVPHTHTQAGHVAPVPSIPTHRPPSHQHKYEYLDGLRGVAALWVVFIHYLPGVSKPLLDLLLGYQFWNASVPLFFMLSGRVLTMSIIKSGDLGKLCGAVIRRPIRLILPLWITGIVDHLVFNAYLTQIQFDQGPFPSNIPMIIWTLSIEYANSNIIYFITLIIIVYKPTPHTRYIVIVFLMIWFEWTHQWTTHFLIGLTLTMMEYDGMLQWYRSYRYSMWINIAMLIVTSIMSFKTSMWRIAEPIDTWIRSIQTHQGKFGVGEDIGKPGLEENCVVMLFSFSLMMMVETVPWIRRVLSGPVFVFIGHISFTMYLIHFHWIVLYGWPLSSKILAYFTSQWLGVTVVLGTMLPMLFYVSYVMVPVLDDPGILVGRYIEQVVVDPTPWTWHTLRMHIVYIPCHVGIWVAQTGAKMVHRATLGMVGSVDWLDLSRVDWKKVWVSVRSVWASWSTTRSDYRSL